MKIISLAICVTCIGGAAHAQSLPGAGSLLQQMPPVIGRPDAEPRVQIDRRERATIAAGGPTSPVNGIRITGSTVFAETTLVTASQFEPRAMTFAELDNLAAHITEFYASHGYFVAHAYLPAQDMTSGIVTIAVVEGRYGEIAINNSSRLADGTVRSILRGLDPADIVSAAPLERRLLLLSDLPGVVIGSTLAPGRDVGTTDLRVDIAPGDTISGIVEVDNSGNRYTGEWRGGGTLYVNNLAGRGDQLSLRVLASTQSLIYGRAAWQAPIGVATAGLAYSHIGYALGREFASLDASGTADILSAFASYPIVRSRRHNVRAVLGGDAKSFTDRARAAGTTSERATRVVTAGVSGDHRSVGGFTTWSLGASFGNLILRTPADQAIDAITAGAEGSYAVYRGAFSHEQAVAGGFSLFVTARGQLASKNLDSSEKMQLGGAYGVRAYPEGEAFGDEGFIASAEARQRLSENLAGLPGRLEVFAFVDTGSVRLAKSPWFAGSNTLNRSGYGGGVGWAVPGNFMVRAAYARKLGTGPATSAPDRSGRFWLQIAKFF